MNLLLSAIANEYLMKLVIILTTLVFSQSLFATNFNISVPKGKFKVKTQKGLMLKMFELSLECRIHSKIRVLGAPVKISYIRSELNERFEITRNTFGTHTLNLENDINLDFELITLFSYVHACSFIANVGAMKDTSSYFTRDLPISDFTIIDHKHNAKIDLKKVFKRKTFFISKDSKELIFK